MEKKELITNETEKVSGGIVEKTEEGWNVVDKDSNAEFKGFKNEQTAKFLDEAWNLIPIEKRKNIDKKQFDSDLTLVKGMKPEDYAKSFITNY
jgi:hypothetical protein